MARKKSRARRSRGAGAKDLNRPRAPEQVMPEPLARAVADLDHWFVIGGHAVRWRIGSTTALFDQGQNYQITPYAKIGGAIAAGQPAARGAGRRPPWQPCLGAGTGQPRR